MTIRPLAFSLSTVLLASAGPTFAQDPEPTYGGTAIVVLGDELSSLNPAITSGSGEGVVGCMVLEGLVEIDGDGNPVPSLAESWTISDDGLSYSFELRETNWHDGEPFTADDVVYAFTNVNSKYAPLFSAQLGKRIESVVADGPHKVTVNLSEPFGPFMRILTCWNGGAITPKHIFEGTDPNTSQASSEMIGTGPFKFEAWNTGDSIRLVKNENYWKEGRPYLDGVVARFMPNAASRVQAMLAGEADFIQKYYFPVSDLPAVEASPDLKVMPASQAPNHLLGFFNVTKPPFDNVELRQTLFSLVDRDFIFQAAFGGEGMKATGPIPKQVSWASNPDLSYDDMYSTDVDAVNAKLDEMGLARGSDGVRFETSIIFEAAVPERLKAATAIQAAWQQVGVKVNVEPLERALLVPRAYTDGDFGMLIISYGTYGDPALGIARIYITSSIGTSYGNASGYSNPMIDDLFAQGATLAETSARGEVYREAEIIIAKELPVITLHENKGSDAAVSNLYGIWGYEGAGRFGEAYFADK